MNYCAFYEKGFWNGTNVFACTTVSAECLVYMDFFVFAKRQDTWDGADVKAVLASFRALCRVYGGDAFECFFDFYQSWVAFGFANPAGWTVIFVDVYAELNTRLKRG